MRLFHLNVAIAVALAHISLCYSVHHGVILLRLLRVIDHRSNLCRMCHSAIHRFYTNRELAEDYWSLELLLGSDKVYAFAKWASTLQGRGNLRTR